MGRALALGLLLLLAGCAGTLAPEASVRPEPSLGLQRDRYVLPPEPPPPEPRSLEDLRRFEREWPPVHTAVVPMRVRARRTYPGYSVRTSVRDELPACGTPAAGDGPCRGVDAGAPTPPLLRAEPAPFAAPPRLTFEGEEF